MIPLFKVFIGDSVAEAVNKTLQSGYLTQGPRVEEFEYHLKRWLDCTNLLTVNSATSGLQLASYLAGGESGVAFISTPMTCSATITAILSTGAYILWADIDPLTGNIDPEYVEFLLKRTPSVKAVVCVDWAGYPCDYDDLLNITAKYDVKLIRDAAHALGATYNKERLYESVNYTVYSFQAIKHLTTVDGGALICKGKRDYDRGKLLRWFGIDREGPQKDMRCAQNILEAGWKYHMNDLNATIGIEQLKYLDSILDKHIENGLQYDVAFKAASLHTSAGFEIPVRKDDRQSAYWIYTILSDNKDEFIKQLAGKGIMSSQVHSRIDKQGMMSGRGFVDEKPLVGVDKFSSRQLNIPVGWWVTPEDRMKIIDTVIKIGKEL